MGYVNSEKKLVTLPHLQALADAWAERQRREPEQHCTYMYKLCPHTHTVFVSQFWLFLPLHH